MAGGKKQFLKLNQENLKVEFYLRTFLWLYRTVHVSEPSEGLSVKTF